jgi:protein MpaA
MSAQDSMTYQRLAESWSALAKRRSWSLREVPCQGVARTLLLVEFGRPDAPVVHITAGVHGDEPGGPWGLLAMADAGMLDERFSYRLWPCTNPSGYRAGTRANAEGNDVNRSFTPQAATPESRAIMQVNEGCRFALAIDLHEDFEADGFYCYEPVVDGTAPLSQAILWAIEAAGFPIQTLDHLFDLGYPKDLAGVDQLRTLERGRVLVNAQAERRFFPGLPQSLYLLRTATRRTVTLETPRKRPWEDRITMHRVAVVSALAQAIQLEAA